MLLRIKDKASFLCWFASELRSMRKLKLLGMNHSKCGKSGVLMSLFSWLDYSENDRRKMLEVIDLFKEHDTRDELGLGAVRDSFADQFFPGTSTIMTRARYFLLVAWTYLQLEKKRVGSAQISHYARVAETALIEAIECSDNNEGNIGKYAKSTLKRLPSSVYWQGAGVWGIREFPGSQVQYHRSLDSYYMQSSRHVGRALERDSEHDDLLVPNWHAGLISQPNGFPNECSLRLRRNEAEYLSERICLSPLCAGSLLAELILRRQRCEPVDFAWKHPHTAELPHKLREMLLHAQNFSELMHGAALLYNLILAEEAKWDKGVATYQERFADWSENVSIRSGAFKEWKRERFWEIAHAGNSRISSGTHDFINTWRDLVLGGNAAGLRENTVARNLIAERERRLKKKLARIGNPRAQELWNGESGALNMEFRWLVSQRLLSDIFDGLEAVDA
jgi:hypothetical protein